MHLHAREYVPVPADISLDQHRNIAGSANRAGNLVHAEFSITFITKCLLETSRKKQFCGLHIETLRQWSESILMLRQTTHTDLKPNCKNESMHCNSELKSPSHELGRALSRLYRNRFCKKHLVCTIFQDVYDLRTSAPLQTQNNFFEKSEYTND